MATRVVHRVRCRKKDNTQIWADVKVVDGIGIIAPNGQEMLISVAAADAVPCIRDETKAKPSQATGEPEQCTRISHMELVSGQDDPTQKMYIEVLDGVAIHPPTHFDPDTIKEQIERRGGKPKSAMPAYNYVFLMPESKAGKYIVDKVGLGLDEGTPSNASRAGHVSLVTEKGNTDDKTDEADAIPPQSQAWVAVVKPDAVNFQVPGEDVCLIIPRGLQDEIDLTKMTTDPDTGEPCPPDNTDPNVYVTFPRDDTGDPNAPTVGCNIKIPTRKGGKGIDQGPLWWIERISSPFRPWFWYAKVQSPKAFSFFGSPGRLGSWAYRGFLLFNYYPVIWILSRNNPLIPMGSFGSPSLDLCARIGNWDFNFPPVPWGPAFVPPRPQAPSIFPFSALSFVGGIEEGSGGPAPYGPFGCLQMTHPPLGKFPDAVPYGNSLDGNDGSQIWSQIPNIWQLTGLPQPKRADMTKAWNPFTNPIVPPSSKDAKSAAMLFRDKWNACANGHNGFIEGYVGGGKVSVYAQPPGWSWNMNYYDPFRPETAGLKYYGAFRNGVPVACATSVGIPLVDFIPATAWTLEVDQLDPKLWDTSKLEMYNNPLNWFLPLIIPPFLKPTPPSH